MSAPPLPVFRQEEIQGAKGPCKVYSGLCAGVQTFNGVVLVVMAADAKSLIDAIREISPDTKINPALFVPASLVHDKFIQREEDEEL